MKQTSFTVKILGGNLLEDKLTTETFYRFRTSKLFNIWMPPFDAQIPVRD